MDTLIYLVLALACPLGMAVMMLIMMCAHGEGSSSSRSSGDEQELARLRMEIAALRDERSSSMATPIVLHKSAR